MKKIMGLWDIVMMNIAAIVGLRWLPIAAGYGASAIPLWILAAMLFFLPLGLVATELATAWPAEGGLYVWIKKAFGERSGFVVSWFYWVNSFFYCPALLIFLAVSLAFAFNPALALNKWYVCGVVLGSLWLLTIMNFISMRLVKWMANISGAFGTLLPGFIVIGLGFAAVWYWHRPIATDYSFSHWIPKLGSGSNIAFLSTLMFSMAGIELTPTLAGETKDPQKTFPRATIISAIFIVGVYILGTLALTFVLQPSKITADSGFLDALALMAHDLHIPYILVGVSLLIVMGQFGGTSVWVVAPIKMLFESTKGGILPAFLTRLNKSDMPRNAIITQSVIISVVTITTLFLPSVNVVYETLVLMATILYFIPYLFLFAAFLKLRRDYPDTPRPYRVPGGSVLAWIVCSVGFISVLVGVVLPFFIPPADVKTTAQIWEYRAELMLGPVFFTWSGYWLYHRYLKRKAAGLIEVEG